MVVFGGTACFGPCSSLYNVCRSTICILVLWAIGQTALSHSVQQTSIAYSAFSGLLLGVNYALSRTTGDHRAAKRLFIRCWNCLDPRQHSANVTTSEDSSNDIKNDKVCIILGLRFFVRDRLLKPRKGFLVTLYNVLMKI